MGRDEVGELLKSPQATGLNRPLADQTTDRPGEPAGTPLTFQLSPAVLRDIGLSAALEWLAEQMHLLARHQDHLRGRWAGQIHPDRAAYPALPGFA
jgi:hypothetical protein